MKRMLLQERLRIACKQPERMSKVGGSRLDPTQNEDLDLVGDIEFRSGGTANGKRSRGEVPETPILEGGSRLGKVPRLEAARAVPKESTVSKRRLSVGDSDGESHPQRKHGSPNHGLLVLCKATLSPSLIRSRSRRRILYQGLL